MPLAHAVGRLAPSANALCCFMPETSYVADAGEPGLNNMTLAIVAPHDCSGLSRRFSFENYRELQFDVLSTHLALRTNNLLNSHPEGHNVPPVYRSDIDGLRAVAILSVVIFHAFPFALQGGFVGVDIFFVISGFLISTIIFRSLERGDFSFTEFYAHRIKRIFPALIVVLSACYAFGWFALLPNEFKQLGKHVAAGTGFIQNFILWQEVGYFDTTAELKPLLHLWSLAIEEQFYLIYPLLIFIAWRIGLNVLIVVFLLALISLGLNISGVAKNPMETFFMPQTRFWELLVGSALAYQHFFKRTKFSAWMQRWVCHPIFFRDMPQSARRREVLNNLLSVVGLLLLIAAVFFINKSRPFPGWWALLPVSGAFILILTGPEAWVNRFILSNRLMVLVGLISYPLYLWHWPILSFLRIIESDVPSPEIRIGAVILSVVLAWLTYRLIEKPIRYGRKRWIKTAALCIVLAVVGYVGYNTFQRNGLAFRIQKEVRRIADFNYEFGKDARAGKCWLSSSQPSDGFDIECIEVPKSVESHSVLVWGDSHAARLYPGLRATLGTQFVISQLTRDSCPPILDFGYDRCKESNDHVIASIQRNLPKTVVMFAVWNHYQNNWLVESAARKGLLESIHRLKKLGVKNIIVLGPAPSWKEALPKLVYKAWKDSFPHRIPERLATGIDAQAKEADKQIELILRSEQSRYVSIYQLICSEDGCLCHIPGRPDELLSWDYGHLTTEGAVLVAKHLSIASILP
ncbi:acyltransferase family protein [Azonexus sp. IMCC34842]|uniref:acyltransferase family protein n=1 Tax=Azonexus sp. IMCC34842 TaxID=3420950 RepID=UPI003D11926C